MWLWPPLSLAEVLACLLAGGLVVALLELIEKRFPQEKKKEPKEEGKR